MYTLATDVDRKVLANMTQNICPKTVSLHTKIAVTFIYIYIYIFSLFHNPTVGSLSWGGGASTCGSSISMHDQSE